MAPPFFFFFLNPIYLKRTCIFFICSPPKNSFYTDSKTISIWGALQFLIPWISVMVFCGQHENFFKRVGISMGIHFLCYPKDKIEKKKEKKKGYGLIWI